MLCFLFYPAFAASIIVRHHLSPLLLMPLSLLLLLGLVARC